MIGASALARHLDLLLRTSEVPDYPGAMNGLQLANKRDVHRIATAVDFSRATVSQAVEAGAQLLLVHHGMFWGAPQPITGWRYDALSALLENGIAVYSSHLPLDLHPQIGNNVLLARELGLEPSGSFATFKNVTIGVSGEADIPTSALSARAQTFAAAWGSNLVATPFPADHITRRWGVCTGAGADGDTIREAVERGIDTIIVGEGPHHSAVLGRDLGLVILYAGHYATETLGVRALGEHLASEFNLHSEFLHAPTGL